LDAKIYSYLNGQLIIGLNEDLTYGHIYEIHFIEVSTIICNTVWSIDGSKKSIKILNDELIKERALNLTYSVEIGNTIFELNDDEGQVFYIIANDIEFHEAVVRYLTK
jgi:hypothetical protein